MAPFNPTSSRTAFARYAAEFSPSPPVAAKSRQCSHDDSVVDVDAKGRRVCAECGLLLLKGRVSYGGCDAFDSLTVRSSGIRRTVGDGRRWKARALCTVYGDIPANVAPDVRNLTVDIYKSVTAGGKIFRDVVRRGVVLACLYHASLARGRPMCLDELIRQFDIKVRRANSGLALVANSLRCRPIAYDVTARVVDVPFSDESACARSLVRLVNDTTTTTSGGDDEGGGYVDFQDVDVVVTHVLARSDIFNKSQSKSAVAGCVAFCARIGAGKRRSRRVAAASATPPFDVRRFAKIAGLSESTVAKKSLDVCRVVYRHYSILARLYARALSAEFGGGAINAVTFIDDIGERIVVRNFNDDDVANMTARSVDSLFVYPLLDVTDLTDWNVLWNDDRLYASVDDARVVGVVGLRVRETKRAIDVEWTRRNRRPFDVADELRRIVCVAVFGDTTTTTTS